jgi:hypothetical protein
VVRDPIEGYGKSTIVHRVTLPFRSGEIAGWDVERVDGLFPKLRVLRAASPYLAPFDLLFEVETFDYHD